MTDTHIVLVEDDDRLAALIDEYLRAHDFAVTRYARGDEAVAAFDGSADMVILDLMLPGMDGLTVCRRLRERYSGPIMMLTAKSGDVDQVVGLELGADDYLGKPVEPRLLLARIRALLRRAMAQPHARPQQGDENVLQYGDVRLCHSTQEVTVAGQRADLTTQEFELLRLLMGSAGKVVSRDQLYRDLRGIEYDGLDRSVDVCVSHLRRKLGDDHGRPGMIKTVWGRGYLFAASSVSPS